MPNNPIDTSLLDKAIIFAVHAHAGTERRGKGFPYIVHPMEAVSIAATMSADQHLLAAAALHDVVEDTCIGIETIEAEFGSRIAGLVKAETDNIEPGVSGQQSWFVRKKAAIDRLAQAPTEVKIIALADKLSNMRAIARDYARMGDSLWSLFHSKNPKDHEWHYRGLAASLSELKDTEAYEEFVSLINKVFENGSY